jgi:hypothetical protein
LQPKAIVAKEKWIMRGSLVAAGVLTALFSIFAPVSAQRSEAVATVPVDATAGHVINAFDPDHALGRSTPH